MNSDFLKRLARSITTGTQEEQVRLLKRVSEEERDRGHGRLADDLDALLKEFANSPPITRSSLQELPASRRNKEILVSVFPRDTLDHHMVLPHEVEERFARIEKEFAARDRLATFGFKPRKTILLYGAPGCGKSLGAKRLAWNIGLPLLKVRFDALLSSYFGESASNLRAVFDAARETPSLLLLDECDFIARSRTNSKDIGEASRIVNSLLQLLEEFDAPGLLVATTNIESSLDEALFRRFDDVFEVPLPKAVQIEELLRQALSGISVAQNIPWSSLVSLLVSSSAAQVVKAAQDAAKAAVLIGQKVVEEDHLRVAIFEVTRRREKAAE
jgi:SpoVK/Ycf46/Vps4 family AAA+-type ATPase